MPGVLNSSHIKRLINRNPALVKGCVNITEQIQPCGIDLTLKEVASFTSAGRITRSNQDRLVSELEALKFDDKGQVHLAPGAYLITYNESVNLPLNLMALVLPRSSLLRSGATVHTAVWDPGYSGRGQSMLSVSNPKGFIVEKDARVVQMIFLTLDEASSGYNGTYQGENLA
ncbi:MAG: deoxyuridine 5'-triphosphate nucleotidohydrolase [Dehalococcoidales bacterium]